MTPEHQTILEYASPATAKPRRIWLPIVCLSSALVVWYWPRLTPTFFPNTLDVAVLILLAPAAFAIARSSSLPGWAFTLYGALSVTLFLLANFNDNNFRANTAANDIVLPWCGMVVAGALVARLIAAVGRMTASR